jgi:protein-tyrosine phosphatase
MPLYTNSVDMDEITENLWLGGCFGSPVLPENIEHVVSLHTNDVFIINHSLSSHHKHELIDTEYLPVDLNVVARLAQHVNECRKTGVTLVHCQAGLNRSGLVAAAALMLDGVTADNAIKLLRFKRNGAVLFNQVFDKFLRTELTEWIRNNADQGEQRRSDHNPS